MRICKCILRKHTWRSVIFLVYQNKFHDALLIVVKIDQICGHICWSRFCWRSMATLSSAVTIKRRESIIFNYCQHKNLHFYGCEHTVYLSCGCAVRRFSPNREYASATGPRQKISIYVKDLQELKDLVNLEDLDDLRLFVYVLYRNVGNWTTPTDSL